MTQLTELQVRLRAGDPHACDALFASAYNELHRPAHARLRDGRRNTILDTTKEFGTVTSAENPFGAKVFAYVPGTDQVLMARPDGFEPPTTWFEGRHSIDRKLMFL